MILYISGQPGHGKTLYGLHLALKFKEEGRVVYVHGIESLNWEKTGFLKLEDPTKWQELPDNSVIVIDECYSTFPNRNAASKVPDYVESMARHRHRGFDFILISQQPNQIDPFVRGLVHNHFHVRRKFGTKTAVIKTWDRCANDPIKDQPLSTPMWLYDKKIYDLYVSATMHTVKRKIPWQFMVVIPLLAFVIYQFYRLYSGDTLTSATGAAAKAAPQNAQRAEPAGEVRSALGVGNLQSHADYEKFITPRIKGIPWTAPAYDNLQVQNVPEMYCISSANSCRCITEQGTPIDTVESICRLSARNGTYNPFKQKPQQQAKQQEPSVLADDVKPQNLNVGGSRAIEQVNSNYGKFRN